MIRLEKIILSIFILVIFSGCVKIPVSKYEQLNSSTHILNCNVSDTYNRIEKIQRRYTVTRAPDTLLTANTFVPMVMGINIDLTSNLVSRAAAINLLAQYTNVLFVFSSKDYLKDTDKACTQLAASAKTFSKTTLHLKSNPSTQIGNAFGVIANAAGKHMIDKKRLNALKIAMDSSQKHIVILTNLLVHDNTLFSKAVDQWREALIRHANAVRPKYATLGRYEFDLEFANLLDEIEDIKRSLQLSNEALEKLPVVMSEIRMLLDKKEVKMEALQELISEGQRLSNVYTNLNK